MSDTPNRPTGEIGEMKHLFPTILIILDCCAAVVYLYYGDKVRVAYWLGAGLLTWCSIWMR